MPELVKHCDVAIGNEEDAEKVFGIRAPGTDVMAGKIEADKYRHVRGAGDALPQPEANALSPCAVPYRRLSVNQHLR
jgi:hypothetical protein